jgi:ankyrin repeat protein
MGHTSDCALAFGACRDVWLHDVQLRWAIVRKRHGRYAMTRLHWASEKGYAARVAQLLDWRSEVDAIDKEGFTPLMRAVRAGRADAARELVRRGASLLAAAPADLVPVRVTFPAWAAAREPRLPLEAAIDSKRAELVGILLESPSAIAALATKDTRGLLPLSRAVDASVGPAVVRVLLERGAAVDALDREGHTALLLSFQRTQCAPTVRLLVQHGADARLRTTLGDGVSHLAAQLGYLDALQALLEPYESVPRDLDLSERNFRGSSPLDLACANGREYMAEFLIERGCDLNATHPISGRSPLALVCASRFVRVPFAVRLLNLGADPNSMGNDGRTPLLRAAARSNEALVAALLAHGADVNARTRRNYAPDDCGQLRQCDQRGRPDRARS